MISISYGVPELAVSNITRLVFSQLAAALAAQGVSIIAASGDDGAAGIGGDTNADCNLTAEVGLLVTWPASDEWVTSVGATMGVELGGPEVVCQANTTVDPNGTVSESGSGASITSGGGFSNIVARPAYQNGHHDNPNLGLPDVALAGHTYVIVNGGKLAAVDGTSASTPVFAGMVSLLNARRLAKGLPSLGFLNPLLYKHSGVFNDITKGDNKCARAGDKCCGGYKAGVGWDAATGLGSVNYARLSAAVNATF